MEAIKTLTVTGKALTVPASARLPIPEYEAVKEQAAKNGISMGLLLSRWIIERLDQETGGNKRCKAA